MKFTKMQGIGNDYVYVNCFEETVKDPAAVARYVSDRHFGIGSDGLILIKPSDIADCEMDMYNLDGSQGAMCGNGIRCVAKYVYDYGIVKKENISVSTKSGIKYLDLTVRDGSDCQPDPGGIFHRGDDQCTFEGKRGNLLYYCCLHGKSPRHCIYDRCGSSGYWRNRSLF